MEIYDILMLIVLAAAGVFGAVKGFAWQVASIASIVVSYFVAYRYREPLSQSILADPPWNRFLAMLILFVGTSLVIWVAFNMLRKSIDRMKLKEFDRQVGALFGLLKGALYCTLITLFAVTLMGDTVRESIVASKSGRFIARNLDRGESLVPPEVHEFLQPYLERFDQEFYGGQANPSLMPLPDLNSRQPIFGASQSPDQGPGSQFKSPSFDPSQGKFYRQPSVARQPSDAGRSSSWRQ